MITLFFYLFLAIGVSFICSVLEAVLLSTTFSYIDTLVKNGVKGGENLKKVKTNMETSIGSILTLNTIANTFGAAGVGAQALHLFGEAYIMFFSMGLTLVILYFSEIIPKTIGATYWKTLAVPSSYIIRVLVVITYPLNFLAIRLTRLIAKEQPSGDVSRDEILTVISHGTENGVISEKESEIIKNLLRLRNIKVRDVLTPRKVVFALNKDSTIADALKNDYNIKRLKQFSRIPIYSNNKDYMEGIVFSQSIFEENGDENGGKKLSEIAIPVFEINENINLSKTLDLFIQRKEHLFIVKDGYSQTAGVVTLEDVFETLLGREIMDELDTIEDMQKYAKDYVRADQNSAV
jgi:CBS domain containing-hemolysin-like protein